MNRLAINDHGNANGEPNVPAGNMKSQPGMNLLPDSIGKAGHIDIGCPKAALSASRWML